MSAIHTRSDELDTPRELALRSLLEINRATASPIGRLQTKEQQVAEFLREGILGGVFARGQKLKQAEIAKQLDISITPVREALKLLEAEGYIQVLAHRGAVVAPFQLERVDELFQLRLMMEPKLTLAATPLLKDSDLEELLALDTMMNQAVHRRDLESTRRAFNFRFHFRLYQAADLPQMLHFVRVVWAKYPFDMLGSLPNRPSQVTGEHEKILQALQARDGRAAMRAMQAHIESGQRLFKANYRLSGSRAAHR